VRAIDLGAAGRAPACQRRLDPRGLPGDLNRVRRSSLARVSFDVSAGSYLRFMGRYSEPLATAFAGLAGIRDGQRALDVGCGPGPLTVELATRLGPAAVSAADPSASFADAVRARLPEVDVRQAPAERLPFPDGAFDAALAQLVVHFMSDPAAGLREMGRVTGPGGVVAACVWDHAGGRGPVAAFWAAARELDPGADDESGLAGVREGALSQLFGQAGLDVTRTEALTVQARFDSFGQWWEPYTLGVGPAGDYLAALAPDARAALRQRCQQRLPSGPFEVSATAWAVTGQA
jgi:SAM-dependent methyltransferase